MIREVLEGKIIGNEKGYAFLVVEGRTEDYFIPHSQLKNAMHGDIVLCETVQESSAEGQRTTARVLKVLKRGIDKLSGTYFSTKTGGIIEPDDKKYFTGIFIPSGKGLRAKTGDKVACKILSYPKKGRPEGIVTKIFGRQFDKNAEIQSILFNFKLPSKFEKPVIEESEKLCGIITENDLTGRKDFRGITTFTIDGIDAKDFDDAVSIDINERGNYLLGVHIADVSHYVLEGGAIDKEAFNRATSVYFPEQVIPMLPERLCNDLCSLVEGKDRLTISCVMEIDSKGEVVSYEISPSVIKSKRRMTYENVQSILDGDENLIKEYQDIYEDLLKMSQLADILTARRNLNGSIDLDVKESAILVSENGEIQVLPRVQTKARKIIEEFMICANCTVAFSMAMCETPFIYRVHEEPIDERLQRFYNFLDGLGVKVKKNKGKVYSKTFQTILESVKDTPNYTLINRVMLRSMQKAKYSENNQGHFGLSERYYCHFTSPIRRYPDLFVHRVIKTYYKGNYSALEDYDKIVGEVSAWSSEQERNAIEAERAVDEYYKLLYLSNHTSEEFFGVVSGMLPKGLFVELANGVEGFVDGELNFRKRAIYDKNNFTYTVGKKTYKLGEVVKIRVEEVNLIERTAQFSII